MPRFRVTLQQDLPTRTPSAFEVKYTFRGAPEQRWFVHNVQPDHSASVIQVDSPPALMAPDTLTRTLIAHYSTAPTEEERQISSVQQP
jgi:hypothetical protein